MQSDDLLPKNTTKSKIEKSGHSLELADECFNPGSSPDFFGCSRCLKSAELSDERVSQIDSHKRREVEPRAPVRSVRHGVSYANAALKALR
jgi:hypothetical protein